ncbi:hypothetical protein GF377_10675, partial [candidate division GN15 bacterium]|nr:hypothetical protein [candidate division GN15 bacterium]
MLTKRITRALNGIAGRRLGVAVLLVGLGLTLVLSAVSSPPSPDLNVRVESFEPTGPVERSTNIAISFTNDLVPEDSLNIPELQPIVTFEPPIAGIARWIEPSRLRFFPDEQLAPATRYTAHLRQGEVIPGGNKLAEDREFTFFTPPLQLSRSRPSIEMVPDSTQYQRAVVTLNFNYPVRGDELLAHLDVRGKENAEVGRRQFDLRLPGADATDSVSLAEYHQTWLVFTQPIPMVKENQLYTLSVGKGLECEDCGEAMPEERKIDIHIHQKRELQVLNVQPVARGDQMTVQIRFRSSVPVETARDFISVDPDIDLTFTKQWNNIILAGDFVPSESYIVTVDKGLVGQYGEILEREFSSRIEIPDFPPSAKFTTPGAYLPRDGAGNLEFETMNIDTVSVEVERVFENNLVFFLAQQRGPRGGNYNNTILGRDWFYLDTALSHTVNQKLTTTVDLANIIGDTARGIFTIKVANKQRRWQSDQRQAIFTDLGISARMAEDYLMVWVHSLADTDPINKATVRLYSLNNQLLLEGRTDSRGVVVFDEVAANTEGFEPFLITVTKDDDLSYLLFRESLLPRSDFDVSGRPYLADGYDAFLYTERGVYRPGDTVRLVSIVRGVDAELPDDFPYLIEIKDPRGREFTTLRLTAGELMEAVPIPIPTYAHTGTYYAYARIGEDYEIGRMVFHVEEFMPDRTRVTVSTQRDTYRLGETMSIEVAGKYFFGPPAVDHRVNGRVTLDRTLFRPNGYSSYSFASSERSFAQHKFDLSSRRLDTLGQFVYDQNLPSGLLPPSALEATIVVAVSEEGGRAVGASKTVTVHPYKRYLGIKTDLDGYAEIGQPVSAHMVAVDPNRQSVSVDVMARFYQIVYNSVLREVNGRYRYVSEKRRQLVDSQAVSVAVDGDSVSFTPTNYGRYEIEVADGTTGHAASVTFYASGWGYAPWSLAEPDKVQIDLDRTEYDPDDKAVLQIRSPFPGKLLLTVESDEVLEMMAVDMEENTATIDLKVRDDYFPNVYITATVVRPAGEVKKHMPARAFGIAPLMISKAKRTLPMAITAPDVIKPQQTVTVGLQAGSRDGTKVAVALVDAGILSLTSYTTPDPIEFFFGKKRPHLSPYDMYALVYPEIERAASHLSPAGGRDELADIVAPDAEAYVSP